MVYGLHGEEDIMISRLHSTCKKFCIVRKFTSLGVNMVIRFLL